MATTETVWNRCDNVGIILTVYMFITTKHCLLIKVTFNRLAHHHKGTSRIDHVLVRNSQPVS